MDGRDNIFVERLWRTVKYEFVYLQDLQSVQQAWLGLRDFFQFYNHERLHQSLDYRTPAEVYLNNRSKKTDSTTFYQPASICVDDFLVWTMGSTLLLISINFAFF